MKGKFKLNHLIVHLILLVGVIVVVFPFAWMILTSFKTSGEAMKIPPTIFPEKFVTTAYHTIVSSAIPFATVYMNTIINTVVTTLVQIVFCSMAGYAFGRIEFPFKNAIFILVLSVLMVPGQIFLLPQYQIVQKLGLLDTIPALFLPNLFSAFGTFLLRQFFMSLPKELEEAAIVERIYEMFLAGQPVKMIAQTLQAEKIEIPGKNLSFSKNMIMNILRNEKYCGDCILQKTVTVDCISKTRKANQGEAPMYIVENNHPAIISREVFNRAQEELSRRNSLRLQSDKTAVTANGRYSKYALTEVLHCAECGSRYKRVTWNIRGKKKIVWRCVSRLDYGKKYCKDSITAEEAALHGAVVRALKRFHAEDESTYLTLMKATIGEAIGINGGSEEIDLLTRRIDTLNKRMLDLVNETVAAGKDVESSEDEFKGISDQIEQLNRRIAAIQESIHKDGSRQARLEEIQNIIAERNANETQYDDSIVRQMIECIKVHNDGRLTIIFGGGYEIEETL